MSDNQETFDWDSTDKVLEEVFNERAAQASKWGEQHRANGTDVSWKKMADAVRAICDDAEKLGPKDSQYTGGATWFNILREEFYEAAAEVDKKALRKELIQVAAVCVAWIEDLDSHD